MPSATTRPYAVTLPDNTVRVVVAQSRAQAIAHVVAPSRYKAEAASASFVVDFIRSGGVPEVAGEETDKTDAPQGDVSK